MSCAPDVRQILLDELHRVPTSVVLADLREVGFLDSTILGVFVSVRQLADEASGQFALINPSPRVAKILTITGLTDVLTSPE